MKTKILFCLLVTLLVFSASAQSGAEWEAFKQANGIDPRYRYYNDWVNAGRPRSGGGGNNGGGYSGPSAADIAAQQAAIAAQKAAAVQKQRDDETQALKEQGVDAYNRNDYEPAIKYFQDALEITTADVTIENYIQKAKDAIAAKKQHEQEAFNASKQEGLSQLRGLDQNGSVNSDSGLKGIGSTDSGLKGLDDNPMGLKDAVADNTSSKKLFKTKTAIQDALSASAYGQDANNPDLGAALERAKVEINKKFDTGAANRGHFDTIVIAGDYGPQRQSQAQTVQVPVELQNDKRFQKLVIERDALQNQVQEIGKQIQQIKDDPAYVPDGKTLTKIDKLQAAQNGVGGMAGHLNNLASDVIAKPTTITSVDFGDSPPPAKRGLDSGVVPSPTQ